VALQRDCPNQLEFTGFRGRPRHVEAGVYDADHAPPYPPDFQRQMTRLAWAGRSAEHVTHELAPSPQAIPNRIQQAKRDEGYRGDGGPSGATRRDLQRLRRELRRLPTLR
jgi:hypothetical protein